MNYAEEQKLKNDRKLLTVAEVCKIAGTTPSVLHTLRRKGLVPNPMKTVGGTALYYDRLDALEIIRHFGRKSFPIDLGLPANSVRSPLSQVPSFLQRPRRPEIDAGKRIAPR